MKPNQYFPRIIDKKIDEYLFVYGAVSIEGPMWCGKTTSASQYSSSNFLLGDSSGNFNNRKLAELSPATVLDGRVPRLIDQWQYVPSIWDAVCAEILDRGVNGQFVLTNSQVPNSKQMLNTGEGLIGKIRMRPMSLFESGDSLGLVSLEALCHGFMDDVKTNSVSLSHIIELIIKGGWPFNINVALNKATTNLKKYLDSVFDDLILSLDGVKRDTAKMRMVLRSLARFESTTASNTQLRRSIQKEENVAIDPDSTAVYLDIFARLFLTDNQPSVYPKFNSSALLKKAAKRHLCDPSIACSLLKANQDNLMGSIDTLEAFFEALCERDLRIYAESFGAELYHYLDYQGHSIDAVIELKNGQWCGFAITMGVNKIDKAAENLLKIANDIIKTGKGEPPEVLCVICGLANAAYCREDGVFVVPITALKN